MARDIVIHILACYRVSHATSLTTLMHWSCHQVTRLTSACAQLALLQCSTLLVDQ